MAYRQHTWIDGSAPALSASNLNEMEEGLAVSVASTNYSTTETKIGTWINGKPIYRKVINVGNMPNTATTKTVASGITNMSYMIRMYGIAQSASGAFIPLPDTYPASNSNVYAIRIMYDLSNNMVQIQTAADRSSYSGYVILEYTKTTD